MFYFSNIPNFDYVSRIPNSDQISNYITTKNLFKRAKLREDIFGDLSYFEKYSIIGDERPDNVAYKFYDDETLDWVILLTNNILNLYEEWPLTQSSFNEYLLEKYKTYEKIYSVSYYITKEVLDTQDRIILPYGIKVSEDFTFEYFDAKVDKTFIVNDVVIPVTNYEFEEQKQNERRNIYILKSKYLQVLFDDIEKIMEYKEGSTQYVSGTLKRGDNIRLYG
jgi:hypothetical protein